MRTAWVLPGGATFGAVQAGLVTALFESGERPDMLVGTSAGALNAAWLAGDPTERGVENLRELWQSMRRKDVFPIQPLRMIAGKLGFSNHIMSSHGLAHWVHSTLPYRRLEHARVPLTVTATDLHSGEAVYFDEGPILPALVASCAIPGVFPPMRVGERWLVDGGPAAFMPISRAVELGAERVFVLPCGGVEPFEPARRKRGVGRIATVPSPKTPPTTTTGVNGAALGAAMVGVAALDLQLNSERCEVYVLPAPSTAALNSRSFTHTAALIDAAWVAARGWLPNAEPVPPGPVDVQGRPRARVSLHSFP